jgi:cysteine desulfurase
MVASLIGAYPAEIIFTSGATESNNMAILGITRALKAQTERRQLVTTPLEHKAVLEPLQQLGQDGFSVQYLPVLSSGRVELETAAHMVSEQTLLVSVQAANNEIGTIQPITELAALAREHGAFFYCDATQAVGKIPIDVDVLDVDLLSLSAHKFYGPKGVGALYIRGGVQGMPLSPLWIGGGQEHGLRSGTLNVPGIVGLGEACALCGWALTEEQQRIRALCDEFEQALLRLIPDLQRNGDLENRLPHNSSLTFPGIDAEALIANVPDLVLSPGSACTSGALEPSYVLQLQAIGLSRDAAYGTVRIGIGRFTCSPALNFLAVCGVSVDRTPKGVNLYLSTTTSIF